MGTIAARAQFFTLDSKGYCHRRRAGVSLLEVTEELCALLSGKVKKSG